jgi:hypothetical protein
VTLLVPTGFVWGETDGEVLFRPDEAVVNAIRSGIGSVAPGGRATSLRSIQGGSDLQRVWAAPTTTDRDRKELLGTLLEDVTIAVERAEYRARLAVRWRSGELQNPAKPRACDKRR